MTIRHLVFCLFWFATVAAADNTTLEVNINGLQGPLLDNARAVLSLEQYKTADSLNALRIQRLHRRARDELSLALQPFGYYQARIEGSLTHHDQHWVARYDIEPGEPATWQTIKLTLTGPGKDKPALNQVIDTTSLKTGTVVNHAVYETLKRDLLQTAQANGYLDAVFTESRLLIQPDLQHASAIITLDTGEQYRLGEISFEGSDLDPELLSAYVPFKTDSVFSYHQLLELQRSLENSDYFTHVDVIPDRKAAVNRRIPVRVILTPHKPNRYTVGLGFGTDTGPRSRLGWANRQLNRYGHKASIDYRVSEIKSALNAQYRIPLSRAQTDFVQFDSSLGRERSDSVDSQFRFIGVKHSITRKAWRRTLSLLHRQEDFELGLTRGNTVLLIPAVTISRIWGKDRLIVDRGARLQLELSGASTNLLSEATFVQATLDAKAIYSPWDRGRILLHGNLGITKSTDFDKLPPSIRFFAGGDHSVRGYDYQSLGPQDASGEVIGGRYLLVGSAEYEHRITGNWRAAAFIDVGNAVDNFNDPLEQGVGIGLRYESPIGLIRLDIADAISEPGNPWRLHLTIGPDL